MLPLRWTGILWFLRLTTHLIGKNAHVSVLSREDFGVMAEMAERDGVFEKDETTIIRNLLRFKDITAADIMTPRPVMAMADASLSIQAFREQHPELRFSRIPIYEHNGDTILGMVLKDDVLEALVQGRGSESIMSLRREILVTRRQDPLPALFRQFLQQRNHIALVVDRYGTVTGLVTMEDVIETLLGLEIMDESDEVEDLQRLARKTWEHRARRMGIDLDKVLLTTQPQDAKTASELGVAMESQDKPGP